MRIRLSATPLARADADLAVLAVTADDLRRPATLAALTHATGRRLRAELERRRFTGAEGSAVLLAGGGRVRAPQLAIVGLGAAPTDVASAAWRRAADQVVARSREVRARRTALALAAAPADLAGAIGQLCEGARLAAYTFSEYRRDRDRVHLGALEIAGLAAPRDPALMAAVGCAGILADATNRARTWINLPAAVLTPTRLAEEAERAGAAAGLTVKIDGPRAIAALGMGALLGVARGSAEEPRFIRLRYDPGKDARRSIALVGKGITFDSGGLSLKTADGMEHMKRDMAGGAAVIAAMTAIAALRPPIAVRAYVPASENMPGGSAMKPGDVLRTAAGKTIEVINTDAEGRLVLADALSIAVRDCPSAIVDIATLTGAIRTALGARVGGIFGNDPALVRALIAAGARAGERLWELPLVRAYRSDLDSAVADLRNVAPEGQGGAIHAALVLEEFVGGCPWAHLDVAGVAFTDKDLPCTPRGAVGFGVRLLANYVLTAAGS
jgi:leucyl aminopeptidase